MRSLFALPLLLLAACHGLTPKDQHELAQFQQNAGLYFDGGKYDQALGLIERGLEIDAGDYKLRSMRAAIYLLQSAPASAEDQRMLDRSLAAFADVYGDRSPSRHDRHVLLYYSLARQKQAMRRFAEAARIDPASDNAEVGKQALREQGNEDLRAAAELLQTLLDRGELPRVCHYHLLQIAALNNDAPGILEHGTKYLEAAAADQKKTASEIDRTTVYGYEGSQKRMMAFLRDEEDAVRTVMAQQLYGQRDYQGALPHVDAVLQIDPTRSDDHYNRGLILRHLGRVDEAKVDLRAFLATTTLPPDSPKVADAVKALTQ